MALSSGTTGYALPQVKPVSRIGTGKAALFADTNAKLKQFSPQSQMAGFQQQATQQAADPNSDPAQNFYNMQQLSDMRQSAAAEDEAKKAALTKQWGEAYGLGQDQSQGGQAQAGGSRYIAQGAQKRYANRNGYNQ